MPAKTALTMIALLGLGLWGPARAESPSFVLRAGRIMPVAAEQPWELAPGTMIVRDGWIVSIGSDLEIPPDLPLLDLPDATIVPGFIAAASELGGNHHGDESLAAAYRAVDAFDRYADYARALASGVTTVHISPGQHRLLTGQGAVVKLAGDPTRRIMQPSSDLAVNLGVPHPPLDVTYSFPASADVAIPDPVPQRPASRLSQFQALESAVRSAMRPDATGLTMHETALANLWQLQTPLRFTAQRAADLTGAVQFLQSQQRNGYVVGGQEAGQVAAALRAARVSVVLQPDARFAQPGGDLGVDPAELTPGKVNYQALQGLMLALAPPTGGALEDLRLIALQASRAGLDRRAALEAITRTPAQILGVADRIGSLEPGKEADFLVLTGRPLDVSSHVLQVYVQGQCVFAPPVEPQALVVQAGTIWVSPQQQIRDGAVLIEDGKITAVGSSVPHPRFARVMDAGPTGFVAPGLIDGVSHLGLDGDKTSADCALRLSQLTGAADVTDLRVCRAGVTTVLVAPYALGSAGATMAAIKTAGNHRSLRVIEDPAAVLFDVSQLDPLEVAGTLSRPLDDGKKYLDAWVKYDKDLKEFLEKKKSGADASGDEKKSVETKEQSQPDPLTGVWEFEIRQSPIAEVVSLTAEIQLLDGTVQGRIVASSVGVTGTMSGTLQGRHLSATVEVRGADLPGPIQLEAEVGDDTMTGSVGAQGISFPLTARRIDKKPIEIRVTSRRVRGKDGRPLPPKVEVAKEPFRAVLEKKIPVVVRVATPAQVREVLDLLVDKRELLVTLVDDSTGTLAHTQRLVDKKVAVIVPPGVLSQRQHADFLLADSLQRAGVKVVFQSNAEDAARHLPAVVLNAVVYGLDGESALAAMTLGAARAFQIDDRVGSLEVGKDADLVIFDGHPFTSGGQVLRVIVNGQEVTQ